MRVFGVGRLVLGMLLPSLVVLRRLTVKLQSYHVYFVRSTANTVKNVLFLMLYCQPRNCVRKLDAQRPGPSHGHAASMRPASVSLQQHPCKPGNNPALAECTG